LDDENDEYEEGKSYLGEYPTISSHHRTKNDMNSSTEQNEQPFKRTIGYAPSMMFFCLTVREERYKFSRSTLTDNILDIINTFCNLVCFRFDKN
jgi:hypothetical protein